ncbi:hydrolase TatD [Candidatus Aerophobetes bacterium]|uniref:Hydrolase TatD n=1 Tax=Aerophobetes bacterium TaxID=2030807 RepID=A0A2A4X344_UNCAE|nr:MAG: hydrolase TatD [Candidatus Aerophobetes bacterium]
MFFDSHAHMTEESMFEEVDAYLKRAKQAGITHIANICTDKLTLARGIELQKRYDWIVNVGATTPHDVGELGEKEFDVFAKAARDGVLAAVGETGLDYHYEYSDKKVQKLFLERYLDLADETDLPVVFHCRDAFDDLFAITKGIKSKAVLHCFTAGVKEALKGAERGWYISISGIATFKRSHELREVIKELPIENMFIETDAPYLAPQSKRGKRNEPSFIVETAEMIAEVKGLTLEQVAKQTMNNAKAFFL